MRTASPRLAPGPGLVLALCAVAAVGTPWLAAVSVDLRDGVITGPLAIRTVDSR